MLGCCQLSLLEGLLLLDPENTSVGQWKSVHLKGVCRLLRNQQHRARLIAAVPPSIGWTGRARRRHFQEDDEEDGGHGNGCGRTSKILGSVSENVMSVTTKPTISSRNLLAKEDSITAISADHINNSGHGEKLPHGRAIQPPPRG
ncbi:unnamed protein product [Heligmosomoides polygyrus]|uniref:Uncharacterized protein n=1 Tax=Heligmosomoides polygyrus TaxID=6339 RepID=A0A183GJ96_HELPZ|nr:unnamed protein product [Heligmosomoides polygyrus]